MAKLTLRDIAGKLKEKLQTGFGVNDNKPFVQSPVGQKINNFNRNVSQAYTKNILQPIANAPRFEFARKPIENKVLSFGRDLALGIPESFVNIPRNLAVGAARLEIEKNKALMERQRPNLRNIASGIAPIAEAGLDFASFGVGSNIAKQGAKQLIKGGIKQAAKKGAISGGLYGATGGLTYGLDRQYGKDFSGKQLLGDVATGAALGGILGGGLAGGGAFFEQVINGVKKLNPKLSQKQAQEIATAYLRDKAGRFAKQAVGYKGVMPDKVPYEPIPLTQVADNKMVPSKYAGLYKNLDKNLNLPENFDIKRIKLGGSVREVTPELRVKIKAQQSTKGVESGEMTLRQYMDKNIPDDVARIKDRIDDGEFVSSGLYKRVADWENKAKLDFENLTKGVESMPSVMKTPELPKVGGETLPLKQTLQSKLLLSQTPQKTNIGIKQSGQALEDIIAQGRKQIGGKIDEPKVSFKQSMDNLYTQWVDRFNPIVQASQKAKGTLKLKGATLRPEYDPEYLVRRLTGAGGIADNQFKTQIEPIIKQVEDAGIPKLDLDTYLANKRMAGFGKVNRDIYGADPVKAGQIVNALETKYPNIGQFADQLYNYQNKGFQEMVDAGFISPENAKIIQGQNPDYAPLKRVMDEVSDYLGLPTRKTMQGSQPITKIKGSTRQIESPLESIIGNTFSQRAAIEKNRVAKAIVGLQEIAGDMGFTKVLKSDADTITVWNNGQKEYWNVGRDIADVAKGVNEEQMNLVLKVLQAPAALLRQGATGRNPEFMIPNIVRDQLDAGITSKYGYIPFVDYVSGLKSMIANDDIYQKWANSGAKIDLGEMSGKKSINAYFDTATKKKGLFSFLGGALDTMGKYSEVPTRVGLFKKAYKKTGNDLISALESRDATVDFARMGSKMKVANSIIPFLNVGVQGFDKLIRSVKNNPAKVLFNATLYGTAPAIATTVYNLANHPKEYAEIPQYEKDSNFVLVKGRNQNGTVDYLTFPKGNVLPTITNPVQSFIDYLYGNNQQSFKEMALQTISSTLPVIGDGQSFNEIALKTVGSNIPQLFKPAAENILNKSFYKYDPKKEQTKDIVPFYLQDEPAYKQTYKFTPQMYQKIGALINASPLKVQNIMEGYLAGYSKIPAQIIETATKASKGEEISPNEKTILRRFIKQTYPTSGTKKVETKPAVPSVMERLGMAPKAAEVPESLITYTKDGKDYEVDLNKSFEYPTMDTSTALGKEAISRYKSEISSQVNKIYDAYKDGKITEQEASDYINQLSIQYDKTKKPKAAKKPKKITLKVSSYKAPKITIKKRSSAKLPTIKFKKPKKTKIVRRYTIK